MKSLLARACSVAVFCIFASVLSAQDWKTTESLPGVDLAGLSAAQKTSALKLVRDHGCPCGCNLKVAQCRIVDPPCAYSKGLAGVIVDAIKAGKSENEALAAADASRFAQIQQPKLLEDPISIPVAGAPSTGAPSAGVTLVEFSDFQCPYCAQAFAEIKQILRAYPTQIKLIFKQFPLEMHPQADLAAAAAVAAQKQGKFWEMHDQLFTHRDDLSRRNILVMAKDTGLDLTRFENDLDSTEVRETVVRDVQDGDKAGVQGTPTIFVNGQHYNGPISLAALKPVLDAELKNGAPKQTALAR